MSIQIVLQESDCKHFSSVQNKQIYNFDSDEVPGITLLNKRAMSGDGSVNKLAFE